MKVKIRISLVDDEGKEYHGEVDLKPRSTSHKPMTLPTTQGPSGYKKRSTVEKILSLAEEGFFKQPRGIKEIIGKLKEKDYHFKASDLTLPLRNIVRKGKLKKIKDAVNGQKSKVWKYIED